MKGKAQLNFSKYFLNVNYVRAMFQRDEYYENAHLVSWHIRRYLNKIWVEITELTNLKISSQCL